MNEASVSDRLTNADEASLRGRPDHEVLSYCAREGRMLLTHDARTMPVHFATHLGDREVPGLIIVPQSMGIGKAVQQLIFIWRTTEAEEWTNSISRLPLSWVP